jgi:hypothetical protein
MVRFSQRERHFKQIHRELSRLAHIVGTGMFRYLMLKGRTSQVVNNPEVLTQGQPIRASSLTAAIYPINPVIPNNQTKGCPTQPGYSCSDVSSKSWNGIMN